MIWLKQLLRLTRYFIVAYQYQLEDGTTGQGSLTATVHNGRYVSPDEIVIALEPNIGGKIKSFLVLNSIEINKRDAVFYKKNYTIGDKENRIL